MEEDLRIIMEEKNCVNAITIAETFGFQNIDPKTCPGLTLAYIGDCIFELIVRTYLVAKGGVHVNSLHKEASKIVCAVSQCEMYHTVSQYFSDEEMAVFKRGRNTKSGSSAKNASIGDYRVATGMEALFGYLYLSGKTERVLELTELYFRNKFEENKTES